MPRIYATEIRSFNHYDCAFHGVRDTDWGGQQDLSLTGTTRLFGNRNVGQLALTSLVVPAELRPRGEHHILNWYARHNLDTIDSSLLVKEAWHALDSWAHEAIVTLSVGCQPAIQLSLYDLLGRRQGLPLPEESGLGKDQIEGLARMALEAFETTTGTHRGLYDLPEEQRDAWRGVGKTMHAALRGPQAIVVPVRQCLDVQITGSPSAFRDFCKHFDTPENRYLIDPFKPSLWVHLEGYYQLCDQ